MLNGIDFLNKCKKNKDGTYELSKYDNNKKMWVSCLNKTDIAKIKFVKQVSKQDKSYIISCKVCQEKDNKLVCTKDNFEFKISDYNYDKCFVDAKENDIVIISVNESKDGKQYTNFKIENQQNKQKDLEFEEVIKKLEFEEHVI